MPETPHYAFKYTLSTKDDVRGSWTEELLSYVRRNTLWYSLKHEVGENYKLHIHLAFVYEKQDALSNGGAKVKSNVMRTIRNHCPTLSEYLADNPSQYAVSCPALTSDEWIASYSQKEGELKYFKLPEDLAELKPYFADLQKDKPKNPEYEAYAKMYEEENREMPCTFQSAWQFFGEHMYHVQPAGKEMKIVSDKKKLSEKAESLKCYINCEVPDMPKSTLKRVADLEPHRFCPRCPEDSACILEARQQFCPAHKKYKM